MKKFIWILALCPIAFISCDRQTQEQATAQNGSVHDPAGDLASKLLALEERIIANPADAELFAERAAVYSEHDSIRNAINDLKRAVYIDSTDARYHLALGQLYYSSLLIKDAMGSFRTAARLDENSLDAKLSLAEIQLVLRNYQQCFDLANEALRIDPHVAKGYYLKGWAYKEMGDTGKAISSYNTAVEQDPSYYDAFMQLALLHATHNDKLTMAYYNSALEIRPGSVEAWYDKGVYCQENGMDSLAIECFDRIKEIDPQNALAWFGSGYVELELRNDPKAAQRHLEKATGLLPTYHQAWYNRGVAYELMDQLDSAKAAYKTALRIAPAYDPAANGLSRLREKGVKIEK